MDVLATGGVYYDQSVSIPSRVKLEIDRDAKIPLPLHVSHNLRPYSPPFSSYSFFSLSLNLALTPLRSQSL